LLADADGRCRQTHHLLSDHAARLDGEFSATHVKQVFERWTEQVDHEDIVKALLTKVVDLWNANYVISIWSDDHGLGDMYRIPTGSCNSYTRLSTAVHLTFVVPIHQLMSKKRDV